jgi:hypothetical protein
MAPLDKAAVTAYWAAITPSTATEESSPHTTPPSSAHGHSLAYARPPHTESPPASPAVSRATTDRQRLMEAPTLVPTLAPALPADLAPPGALIAVVRSYFLAGIC